MVLNVPVTVVDHTHVFNSTFRKMYPQSHTSSSHNLRPVPLTISYQFHLQSHTSSTHSIRPVPLTISDQFHIPIQSTPSANKQYTRNHSTGIAPFPGHVWLGMRLALVNCTSNWVKNNPGLRFVRVMCYLRMCLQYLRLETYYMHTTTKKVW